MALAKMLGYRLQGAQAATAEVWLQLARVPVASVTIPAGTVLRTQEVTEPVRFQLLAPRRHRGGCRSAARPRAGRELEGALRSSSTRGAWPTSSCTSTSRRTSTTRP
jgi:hypothetical protein